MLKEDNHELIHAISFAQCGKNRSMVIRTIAENTRMPSQIATDLKLRPSQISATLTELKSEKIVICLNEEKKRGRLYQLTELGLDVYKFLDENVEEK